VAVPLSAKPGSKAAHPIDVNGGTVLREGFFFGDIVTVPRLYWEDFAVGRVFEHGPRRLPRDEMIEFAAEFDPQPMHIDEAAARESMMDGLSASGWYACSIVMRMIVDGFVHDSSSRGAPGVDEVKWLLPIRPEDEVRLRATVLDTRVSKGRPDMGFVRFSFELFNGMNQRVMTMAASLMMGRRDTSSPDALLAEAPRRESE
jgi:acyl dehydratase